MRLWRAVTFSRSVIRAQWSSSRRAWWTSFLLVTLLSGLWAVANPPLAGPDEPAHVIRAVALDHGQLTGRRLTGRLGRDFARVEDSVLVVRAPAIYRSVSNIPCFALQRGVAACLEFAGPSDNTDVVTYAARNPPWYYAVVGLASYVWPPGSGTIYLMRFLGALMTGAFIATAVTALRRTTAPEVVAIGLLLAVTPMVLFVGGSVGPSSVEIAAAVTLWTCGLVLVSRARERVDDRLVTAVGIACCVVALSRELGPLWLALIVLTLLAVSSRPALRNLARSRRVRLWTLLAILSALIQVGWDVVVRPRDATLASGADMHLSTLAVARDVFGRTFQWYQEMIGRFGWLDTPAPVLTWVPWVAAIVVVVLSAVAWARRREVTVLLLLIAVTVVVPIVVEVTPYRSGGTFWQGRDTLPLALGIPVLAAVALASTEQARGLIAGPRLVLTIGVLAGIAHILAFAQNLRRYTVGYDGDVMYWFRPLWSPPVPAFLLTVAYTVAVVAFVSFLLIGPAVSQQRTPDRAVALRG